MGGGAPGVAFGYDFLVGACDGWGGGRGVEVCGFDVGPEVGD